VPYVITGGCCADASCIDVCPVDCIHPTPSERDFLDADMLFIDPDSCIECGACRPECPVDAISPDHELTPGFLPYLSLAQAHFSGDRMPAAAAGPVVADLPSMVRPGLRVAVVGAGAAGGYAARELLKIPGVQIDVYERNLTPYGLVRFGIAPDHPQTKLVEAVFPFTTGNPNLRLHLGVEVGRHITREELVSFHHAVIYAAGASGENRLQIPGVDLAERAGEFVAWYNGDPRAADRSFDLTRERVIVIGNGNVALDVARILTSDADRLARTDIADHALAALRSSNVREVVVVGRRGVTDAAYSYSEMLALQDRDDIEVVFDASDLARDDEQRNAGDAPAAPLLKAKAALTCAVAGPQANDRVRKRVILRYLLSPTRLSRLGSEIQVDFAEVAMVGSDSGGLRRAVATGIHQQLHAGLVLSAIGFRADMADLPVDPSGRSVLHQAGRVLAGVDGEILPAVYVTGWLKRGPRGVVGSNKACAIETVGSLLEDYAAGTLTRDLRPAGELEALLSERQPGRLDAAGWLRVDALERRNGRSAGRPRRKLTSLAEITEAAR
jgi:ferredoxin/flavodoxin---NADP+ reductase